MLVDLATVLVAALTLIVVRFPDLLFRKREETIWKEISGGLRYIARRRSLVAMIVFFGRQPHRTAWLRRRRLAR